MEFVERGDEGASNRCGIVTEDDRRTKQCGQQQFGQLIRSRAIGGGRWPSSDT